MKVLTIISILLLIFGLVKADCPCGNGKDFIRANETCSNFPQSNETGAIANCQVYNYNNNASKWECTTCEPQYHKSSSSQCDDGGVANCKAYQFDGTNYHCYDCVSGFYLWDYQCIENPDTIANCVKYQKQSDDFICSECKENHTYKSDSQECVANPDSIPGCKQFAWVDNEWQCRVCQDGYIKEGDQVCHNITDKIPGCLEGSKKHTGYFACSRCQDGKMPVDNQQLSDECVDNPSDDASGLVENCQRYKKEALGAVICLECKQNFGLRADDACEDLGSDKVENCESYEMERNQWVCQRCTSGYYGNQVDNPTSCTICPQINNINEPSDTKLIPISTSNSTSTTNTTTNSIQASNISLSTSSSQLLLLATSLIFTVLAIL